MVGVPYGRRDSLGLKPSTDQPGRQPETGIKVLNSTIR